MASKSYGFAAKEMMVASRRRAGKSHKRELLQEQARRREQSEAKKRKMAQAYGASSLKRDTLKVNGYTIASPLSYATTDRITISGSGNTRLNVPIHDEYVITKQDVDNNTFEHMSEALHVRSTRIKELERTVSLLRTQKKDMLEGIEELREFAERKVTVAKKKAPNSYHLCVMEEIEDHCGAIIEGNEG